jgi:LysR family transcriptional regulator, nitrogen assimilation regulatory protein
MELRQLRYFVAIVDYASLSRAANVLHVAQPALSQHVRRLEAELRVVLLERSPKGVIATDAGLRLYKHAKQILAGIDGLPAIVNDAVVNPSGEVRLGMSGTVSELVTVPLIEAARRKHAAVRIRPVEAMSGYVLDMLHRGEIDLALIYAIADPKGLVVHRMLTEELCLVGKPGARPAGHKRGTKLSLSETLKLDLIVPGASHGLRGLIEEVARAIQQPVLPTLEIDSYSQIKKLAQLGAGYGILPETAIVQEVKRRSLDMWRIDRPALRRGIYLAYSSERPVSAAMRAVALLAWEVTRRLVADGVWIAKWEAGAEAPSI